jgi:hypothetical protein
MEEPFDQRTVRGYILAILNGPGMTVFSWRARRELVENDMTSADAVNVLRGGTLSKGARTPVGWRYRAETRRMGAELSFRGHERSSSAAPNELVIESAWRNTR